MTAPMWCALQLAIGCSHALACRALVADGRGLGRALRLGGAVLAALEALVLLPIAATSHAQQPAWSLMYWVAPARLPLGALLLLLLGVAAAAFVGSALALWRGALWAAWAPLGAGALGTVGLAVAGGPRLATVAAAAASTDGAQAALAPPRPWMGSELMWLTAVALPLAAAAWAFGLWRLWLLGRAEARLAQRRAAASPLSVDSAAVVAPPPPPGAS